MMRAMFCQAVEVVLGSAGARVDDSVSLWNAAATHCITGSDSACNTRTPDVTTTPTTSGKVSGARLFHDRFFLGGSSFGLLQVRFSHYPPLT